MSKYLPSFLVFVACCLLFLSLSSRSSQSSAADSIPEWQLITHEAFNFQVAYPSEWVAELGGEHGYRGADDIKLVIREPYRPFWFEPISFTITVRYRFWPNPSPEEVIKWGRDNVYKVINRDRERAIIPVSSVPIQDDELNGMPIQRRRYSGGGQIYEDVYITAPNGMYIVMIREEADEFDELYEKYEQIVQSFQILNEGE